MLVIIRSSINKEAPQFNKGDKLVSSNVLADGTIEYVINRPDVSYCLKSMTFGKYYKQRGKVHFVDIVEQATLFKDYNKAKEAKQKLEGNNLNIEIIEITE